MTEKRGKVYNRIFDEIEWKEVNQENKDIVQDYLEEYRQRKVKPTTIAQYYNDLRIVLLYIYRKLNNKCIFELNKKDFRRFSLWLTEDLKVSNARSNRLMSAVRSMLTYCEDDDEYDYDSNVAKKVKGLPKEPVKTNEDDFFLSYKQVMTLRDELIKRDKLQHAVLLMILFDSGARRNECFQVKKTGLLDGNKSNIVIGKRGKTFPLIYLDDTRELIRQYLEQRGEDDIESLWISGSGENKKPATYESLYDRVVYMSSVLSEVEGRELQFFPHSLRHSRIECLLRGEDDRLINKETGKNRVYSLEEVQAFSHHSDPKITQLYAKDRTEERIDNMFFG